MQKKLIFGFIALLITVNSFAAAPVVYGGPKILVGLPVDSVLLSAGVTFSAGRHLVSASWTRLSGPNSPTISNSTVYNYATPHGLIAGTYIFQISITDDLSQTGTANDTIVVFTKTAGAHYTINAGSGNLNLTPASTSPALQHGDTLDITNGNYATINRNNLIGAINDSIHIRFINTKFTSLSFNGGSLDNCQYVVFEGENYVNYYGTIGATARLHGLRFHRMRSVNDSAVRFPDQPFLQFYDQGNNDPSNNFFRGSYYQCITGMVFTNCYFSGYKNQATGVISYGQDTLKSMCLDFKFYNDTFHRLDNTSGNVTYWLSGTGFGFDVGGCFSDSLGINPGGQGAHMAYIFHWGSIRLHDSKFAKHYAQPLRLTPLQWYGLPNYGGGASYGCYIYNNVDTGHHSYSMMETSPNNVGPRITSLNSGFSQTFVYFNTVYKTVIASYLAPYFGMVVDDFIDSVYCHNNVIISPEYDATFNPSGRGYYVMDFPNGPKAALDSSHNWAYQYAVQCGFDSIGLRLVKGSILVGAADAATPTVNRDFYNRQRAIPREIGAFQLLDPTFWIFPRRGVFKNN
jgi:hypothetical protein